MNIWNKVLIGLICPLAILAIFWSAKVINHYTKRGAEIKKIQDETVTALKSIETNQDFEKGIPMLEVRNAVLLADRAENWRDCIPKSVESFKDPLKGNRARIIFSVNQEPAPTMVVGDLIYVFDQRPFGKGGKYLGRFAVSRIQGTDVTAESLDVLTDLELQNLASSRQEIAGNTPVQGSQNELEQGTPVQPSENRTGWSIFSRCPTDRRDLFLSMEDKEKFIPASEQDLYFFLSNEDKEKYLPASIRDLYSQDPKDFEAIDFGTLFAYFYQKRIDTATLLEEKLMHQAEIAESNRLAAEAFTFCQNENRQLESEIGQMKAQLQEIEELCTALNRVCDQMKTRIEQTQRENEQKVEELRKIQLEILQKGGRTAAEPTNTALR